MSPGSAPFDAAIPSDARIATLLPGRRSILRRRVSDPRALLGAGGYALTLQVAHPTIAAGVREFSSYSSDPWGRAFRTADYVFLLAYGTPQTVGRLARELRANHRAIKGTDPSGRRYSALEPSAYAWVHATIGEAVVRGHRFLGTTFTASEREEFWQQWLGLGEILGVRPGDLPESWRSLERYVQAMVHDVLEDSDVVQDLWRASLRATGGTPFQWLPEDAFAVVGRPLGNVLRFFGVGLVQPELRERLHYPWTERHQRLFDAACRASKASTPLLPRFVRQAGPMALRARQRESGPFGRRVESLAKAG